MNHTKQSLTITDHCCFDQCCEVLVKALKRCEMSNSSWSRQEGPGGPSFEMVKDKVAELLLRETSASVEFENLKDGPERWCKAPALPTLV